jgi:hypothetical protein
MSKLLFLLTSFIFLSQLLYAKKSPIELSIDARCGLSSVTPFDSFDKLEGYSIIVPEKTLLGEQQLKGTLENRTTTLVLDDGTSYILSKPTSPYEDYYYQADNSFATTKPISREDIQKITVAKSLYIKIEYPARVKKKVEVPNYSLGLMRFYQETGAMVEEEQKKEYKYVEEIVTKTEVYPASINQDSIKSSIQSCHADIQNQANQKLLFEVGIIALVIFGIYISFLIIRGIIRKSKQIASTASERIHEYRVQKIAEDEAIRSTVSKAVRENDNELDKLQNLINNAVAKGDTETARALLEILEKQKQKKEEV